jgi:hypothetical protein
MIKTSNPNSVNSTNKNEKQIGDRTLKELFDIFKQDISQFNFFHYLKSFIQRPWSFIFFVNLVCFGLLFQAQVVKKTVCPDGSLCAPRSIADIQIPTIDNPRMTGFIYLGFYLLGILMCHGYSYYAKYKGNLLLSRLSEIVAMFYISILIIFTIFITYFFLTSTNANNF